MSLAFFSTNLTILQLLIYYFFWTIKVSQYWVLVNSGLVFRGISQCRVIPSADEPFIKSMEIESNLYPNHKIVLLSSL